MPRAFVVRRERSLPRPALDAGVGTDMNQSDPIYLDYNATTPLLPEVVDAMLPYLRVRSTTSAPRLTTRRTSPDRRTIGAGLHTSPAVQPIRRHPSARRRRLGRARAGP